MSVNENTKNEIYDRLDSVQPKVNKLQDQLESILEDLGLNPDYAETLIDEMIEKFEEDLEKLLSEDEQFIS